MHKSKIKFRTNYTSEIKTPGRPRTFDHKDAIVLKKEGLSFAQIAIILGVSKGAIQHAVRKRK